MIIKSIYLIFNALALIYIAKLDHFGIYVGIAFFWIIGSFNKSLTIPAIWSIIIFMSGFAVMRIIKIFVNGFPDAYTISILCVEILLVLIGIVLIKDSFYL